MVAIGDNRDCQLTLIETTLEWKGHIWCVLINRIQACSYRELKKKNYLTICRLAEAGVVLILASCFLHCKGTPASTISCFIYRTRRPVWHFCCT